MSGAEPNGSHTPVWCCLGTCSSQMVEGAWSIWGWDVLISRHKHGAAMTSGSRAAGRGEGCVGPSFRGYGPGSPKGSAFPQLPQALS